MSKFKCTCSEFTTEINGPIRCPGCQSKAKFIDAILELSKLSKDQLEFLEQSREMFRGSS